MYRLLCTTVGILWILTFGDADAQQLYYSDEFIGGVTAGGYAPSHNAGGTGFIQLFFPPNAIIRKAYLFGGDLHSLSSMAVTLNGKTFVLDNTNIVTPGFTSVYGSPAYVH